MNKNELKQLIRECISEIDGKGGNPINKFKYDLDINGYKYKSEGKTIIVPCKLHTGKDENDDLFIQDNELGHLLESYLHLFFDETYYFDFDPKKFKPNSDIIGYVKVKFK